MAWLGGNCSIYFILDPRKCGCPIFKPKAMPGEEELSNDTNFATDSYDEIADVGIHRMKSARSFSSMSPLAMKCPFNTIQGEQRINR